MYIFYVGMLMYLFGWILVYYLFIVNFKNILYIELFVMKNLIWFDVKLLLFVYIYIFICFYLFLIGRFR